MYTELYLIYAVPSEPEELTVDSTSITHNSVILKWKPLSSSNRSNIHYIVEWKSTDDEEFEKSPEVSDSSYKVTGLTGNTEYCFRVAAVNSAGQGPYKNLVGSQCTSKSIIVIAYKQLRVSLVIMMS